jgi:hypothetical protein
MFVLNDDLSIYVTRGDIVFFDVTAKEKGEEYTFKAGDVVRVKVFGKKDAENVVLEKDFPITKDSENVEILLTAEDTKIGEVISKPRDYWYEIELNPLSNPQTIIGYDEDGPKVFKLFPEGADIPKKVPTPEDIPFIDSELDLTSPRPVENQAIARAIARISYIAETVTNGLAEEKARLDNLLSREDAILNQPLEYMSYISEETKSKIDAAIDSDGCCATITVNLHEANLFYGGSGMDVFIIPAECRPIDIGHIHTEGGLEYIISYDNENNRYLLYIGATSDVLTAPESAGIVTISYALADYELKDLRVGADGVTYPTAGEAVRAQFEAVKTALNQIMDAIGIDRG